MKKKILIGLGTLLICSAAFQILAADGDPSATAPQPGIDVEIWARPTEVSPGEIVYAGGRVTNMGDLPDRVRVYLSVHTRVFSKRLARYEFKLRPGETERFRSKERQRGQR